MDIKYISKAIGTIAIWGSIAYILTTLNASGGTIGWSLFFGVIGTAVMWES